MQTCNTSWLHPKVPNSLQERVTGLFLSVCSAGCGLVARVTIFVLHNSIQVYKTKTSELWTKIMSESYLSAQRYLWFSLLNLNLIRLFCSSPSSPRKTPYGHLSSGCHFPADTEQSLVRLATQCCSAENKWRHIWTWRCLHSAWNVCRICGHLAAEDHVPWGPTGSQCW